MTTRLVFSYSDRISSQWKKGTWSRTIRNTTRRGVAESLSEERLQHGANKLRRGLFEGNGEGMEEDHPQFETASEDTGHLHMDSRLSDKRRGGPQDDG